MRTKRSIYLLQGLSNVSVDTTSPRKNMNINESFVFLDSSFTVTQGIQLSIIRAYANKESLAISFYGGELCGQESRHAILLDYASRRRCPNFIFYSLSQFISVGGLDLTILRKLRDLGGKAHFAAQGLKDPTEAELQNLYLLSLSIFKFSQSTIN